MVHQTKPLVASLEHPCVLVLDAFFATGSTFKEASSILDQNGNRLLHIVTRAKKNVVAFMDPPPRTGERGRPKMYGEKVKLMDVFHERADEFEEVNLNIYGKEKTLSVLCLDLLWKPLKEKVRFVLVLDGDNKYILMSSSFELKPSSIIQAYSYRFKIEVSFKVMKHLLGSFYYQFWTKAMPKLDRKGKTDLSNLDSDSRRLIGSAANAIEGFVILGCIATGILQLLSILEGEEIWKRYKRWLRTYSSRAPSEETVRSILQEEFYHNFYDFRNDAIYQFIMSKRDGPPDDFNDDEVA